MHAEPFEWLEDNRQGWVGTREKPEWREYDTSYPWEHKGHEAAWTVASGVWYCYSCGQHYRVPDAADITQHSEADK